MKISKITIKSLFGIKEWSGDGKNIELVGDNGTGKTYPPRYVYVSRSRILCAKNGMFEEMKAGGGSAVAYAWYEFQKGYKGVSIIKWIN